MKLINKFKSPNFDSRKSIPIKFIIIHYTALRNCQEAIKYLCNKDKKVSCHYLISKKGEIYQLVNDKKRAWHAGISCWGNITDINSHSIGVELDYDANIEGKKFSTKMINSLSELISSLKSRYNIENTNILAHSDIAPFRKIDPGKMFPWKKLVSNNLSFNPDKKNYIKYYNILNWFKKNKLNTNKKIALFILSFIGFNTFNVKLDRNSFKKIITSYQLHFVQSNITGKFDLITKKIMINHFLNLVLTKK